MKVVNKIKSIIMHYIISEDTPLRSRLFNLVTGIFALFILINIITAPSSNCAFMLFPFLFIINQGISGAMPIYIVFAAVVINLLLRGKTRAIVLALYLISAVGLVVIDYLDKERILNIIRAFESDFRRYTNVGAGIVLCSMGLGFLINFQNRIYERERKILQALYEGHSAPEIAAMFSVSLNTIKAHIGNIYEKLGAHKKVDAFRIAVEYDLL